MEPADSIIRKLGGVNAVAEIAHVHRTRVSNWKRAREAGGTGGVIPLKHIPALLDASRNRGVDLAAQDFLPHKESAA